MIRVPASGPCPARIMIVGEAPGSEETRQGQPFVGTSGNELSNMLHEAGILRSDCFITNACKYQPPGNRIEAYYAKLTPKECIPGTVLVEGIRELWNEIEAVQPSLIIALGNTALYATTGERSVSKWRGSILPAQPPLPDILPSRTFKVISTYHPSAILRMWSWRHIAVQDLRRCVKESEFPEIRDPGYVFHIKPSYTDTVKFLENILSVLSKEPLRVVCDIETLARQISCIGLGINKHEAMCIPILSKERPEGYWSYEEEFAIVILLRQVLGHSNARVCGQNFIYDMQYLIRYWGVRPNLSDDTMIAWHTLFPGEKKSLDFISSMCCEHYAYWKDELKDYKAFPANEEDFWAYNCKDIVYTFEDMECLAIAIDKSNLREQYQFLIDLHIPVINMMLRGTKFNVARKGELSLELWDTMLEYDQRFETMLPSKAIAPKSKSPWWNSPVQLKKLLYAQCGAPMQIHKKTRKPTTDDEALEALKTKFPLLRPLYTALQEYRSLGVFKNNFIDTPIESDNRIRCSFAIAGPETFRFSSSADAFGFGTNLQNIPTGNE